MGDNGQTPLVQIPAKAVSDSNNLRTPITALLESLSLLAKPEDSERASGWESAFTGPPQSVALIEAGATAASKWWAAGFGATAVATWARVFTWWGGQHDGIKAVVAGGAFVITAAAVIAIALLFASDVRGRAEAAVATVKARSDVAIAMIEAAKEVNGRVGARDGHASAIAPLIALPTALHVSNVGERADEEAGWRALAVQLQGDGSRKYLVVNGQREELVDGKQIEFVPASHRAV